MSETISTAAEPRNHLHRLSVPQLAAMVVGLETELAKSQGQIEYMDHEMARLRSVNKSLRESAARRRRRPRE